MGCCSSRPDRPSLGKAPTLYDTSRSLVSSGAALGSVAAISLCVDNHGLDAACDPQKLPPASIFIASLHVVSNHRRTVRVWKPNTTGGWVCHAVIKTRWSRREKEILDSICATRVRSHGYVKNFVFGASNRTVNTEIAEDDDDEQQGFKPSSTGGPATGLDFARELAQSEIHNTVKVWDGDANFKMVGELKGHKENVTCVFSLDDYVFSASEDGTIIIWRCHIRDGDDAEFTQYDSLEEVHSGPIKYIHATYHVELQDAPDYGTAGTTDSVQIASWASDKQSLVRQSADSVGGTGISPHKGPVKTPPVVQFVTVENGGFEEHADIKVWRQEQDGHGNHFTEIRAIEVVDAHVTTVHLHSSPSREILLVGVLKKNNVEVWIYNLATGAEKDVYRLPILQPEEPFAVPLEGATIRHDSTGSFIGDASRIVNQQFAITSFAIENKHLIIATADGMLRAWDITSLKCVRKASYNSGVNSMVLEQFLFTGHENGEVKVFPINSF